MKKILVSTDFSGVSRNAEEYAVLLAKIFEAKVHLLHVYRDLMPATVGPEPWTIEVSEKRVENEKLIAKEINYLKLKYGSDVEALVETGSRAKLIRSTAEKIEAGLIVMGMRGGKRSRILGSTVLNTIRKSKTPVLIVPEAAKFTALKNIVLAVDFTEMLTGSCFDPLLEICKKNDSSLKVLHVEDPRAELKASEVPEKMQLGLALSRFTYQYEKAEGYDVEDAIGRFLDKHPTDLLVLIAHHHTLYERIFETIHTKDISFKIKIPLLVLRQ